MNRMSIIAIDNIITRAEREPQDVLGRVRLRSAARRVERDVPHSRQRAEQDYIEPTDLPELIEQPERPALPG